RYYGPAAIDFNATYLVGTPSSWILDSEGRKFPVFSVGDREVTDESNTPTVYLVDEVPVLISDIAVLTTPDEWLPIPGSSRSTARIPSYTAIPTVNSTTEINTKMIGRQRKQLLANPRGFVEIEGQFVPYW